MYISDKKISEVLDNYKTIKERREELVNNYLSNPEEVDTWCTMETTARIILERLGLIEEETIEYVYAEEVTLDV